MTQKVEYGPDDCMNSNGSSLRGYHTTTYDNLVAHFGKPNCLWGDKTWNSWDLCFTVYDDDGIDSEDVYASIYDWKEMGPESSKGEYRWHIGGHTKGEHKAHWLVTDLLTSDPTPYDFVRRYV